MHVFPEGKIVQSGVLGAEYFGTRSEEEAQRIGKLKWGVGKLIAHSPVPIRMIPFHHIGMEGIVPQKGTGETLHKYPLGGNAVKLRVGDRIYFDDIIEEYENKHGKLYKYGMLNAIADKEEWKILGREKHELQLYSAIARRIEVALEKLEVECKGDSDMIVQEAYKKLRTEKVQWDR